MWPKHIEVPGKNLPKKQGLRMCAAMPSLEGRLRHRWVSAGRRRLSKSGGHAVSPQWVAAAEEGELVEAQDDFQKGERVTVKVLDPVKPSQKEIDEHEPTHLPVRN